MNVATVQAASSTAQTRPVTATRIDFAYRRFGHASRFPIVMLQHFRGDLDNWASILVNALADEREVILVDYARIGSSTGEPTSSIANTARQMIAFMAALDVDRVDLLGFSIGGFVAQEIALVRPTLVRRPVLAATSPREAPGMLGWQDDIATAVFGESKPENLLCINAEGPRVPRSTPRASGRAGCTDDRRGPRRVIRRGRRVGHPDQSALQRLTGTQCPTLVIQGDSDLMIPPKVSHLMAGLIPDSPIRIYADAAHGFLFQYPAAIAADISSCLAAVHNSVRS